MFHVKRRGRMSENDPFSALSVAMIGPLVEHFLAKTDGWTATKLGRVACKDPSRIHDLRQGVEIRSGTAKRIISVIDQEAPGLRHKFLQSQFGG